MTAEQLRSLPADLVVIGSHSVNHRDLTVLGEKELSKELVESRNELGRILNKEINLLAFPYGKHNKNILKLSKQIGYEHVFSVVPTLSLSNTDRFLIGRILVSPNDWLIEFKLKLTGAYRWLAIATILKRKLISLSECILN